MEYLQHVPSIMMPYWNETFEKGASIVIPDLEEIADQMPSEYNMLKIQDVHSEIAVPIFYKDRLTGFIGLDNPSMKDQKLLLQLLNLVGNHLGSNRENIRMMNLLKSSCPPTNCPLRQVLLVWPRPLQALLAWQPS